MLGLIVAGALIGAASLKKLAGPRPTGFSCPDCRTALTFGQSPCPSCGAILDWSGVNDG